MMSETALASGSDAIRGRALNPVLNQLQELMAHDGAAILRLRGGRLEAVGCRGLEGDAMNGEVRVDESSRQRSGARGGRDE